MKMEARPVTRSIEVKCRGLIYKVDCLVKER